MAVPYSCAKCGAGLPARSANAALCGKWRWLAVHEWFVLIAAIAAGIGAFINS
jgi:hypothetical protein